MARRIEVPMPSCRSCPLYYVHSWATPIIDRGVVLHYGDRACKGGKGKVRRFRPGDPKNKVPSWCPKRKSPCELRVYGFKSTNDWLLHEMMCRDRGANYAPIDRRYAVVFELETELTPREFSQRCNTEPDAQTIHVAVHSHWVVEIDDGIQPVCFYKHEGRYNVISGFDTKIARKNVREDYPLNMEVEYNVQDH